MKSQLAYGKNDFVQALTTPYGTTRFSTSSYKPTDINASLEIVDPLGQRERVEFYEHFADLDPPSALPSGIPLDADTRHRYEAQTLYWSKGALSRATDEIDHAKAKITFWTRGSDGNVSTATGVKSAERKPLENGVFYFYPGQPNPTIAGTMARPNRVARVLSFDPATGAKVEENHLYQYNSLGHPTQYTDPVGRETAYEYSADGIDLTAIKQRNGTGQDVLWSAIYNPQHLPTSITDASGQTTTLE